MKAKNENEMKAVVAYMSFGEDAWQYAEMNIEDPDEDLIESAIYYAIEKAGINISDKEALQKQVAYYYVDGQYEIDHDVLKDVAIPDVEDVFEELNIFSKHTENCSSENNMKSAKPEEIAINHDDYLAEHVGKTQDGRQFFLTKPFKRDENEERPCDYIALYLFDLDGNLVDSIIDKFGVRGSYNQREYNKLYQSRLNDLGNVDFCKINVKPFSISKFDIEFGLVPKEPKYEYDDWVVELLPDAFIKFYEPWGNGKYNEP